MWNKWALESMSSGSEVVAQIQYCDGKDKYKTGVGALAVLE